MTQKFLGIVGTQVTEIAETGVTSVTGTAPVVSSGTATPAISMAKATAAVDGYLAAADFTTFNGKWAQGDNLSQSLNFVGNGVSLFLTWAFWGSPQWQVGSDGATDGGVLLFKQGTTTRATFNSTSFTFQNVVNVNGVTNESISAESSTGIAGQIALNVRNTATDISGGVENSVGISFGNSSNRQVISGATYGNDWLKFFTGGDLTTPKLTLQGGNANFSGAVGFNGTSAPTKPTITGSRSGNAALASLLTALASYGLITDSTTA